MIVVDLSTVSMAAGCMGRGGVGVMAVKAGFQCRAAGWHSDEGNDVSVSHRITQQTRGHRAGPDRRGPQMHPLGTESPKAWPLVFW